MSIYRSLFHPPPLSYCHPPDAVGDEPRQRERLEKEVRAMHEQFSQLKALLDSERKARVEQAPPTLFL
jgi:hypothetical protein